MFLIFIIICLLSSVIARGGIEDSTAASQFHGDYNLVYVWPNINRKVPNCLKVKYSEARDIIDDPFTCQCGRRSPNLAFLIQEVHYVSGAVLTDVVTNQIEVSEALKDSCNCQPLDKKRTVLMKVNDNYFLQYDEEMGVPVTYLFSKTVPTEEEVYEVIKQYDELKEKDGMLVCKE